MRELRMGIEAASASEMTFAPPSISELSTSIRLPLNRARHSRRLSGPSHRYRGFSIISDRAWRSIPGLSASPKWMILMREDSGSSRAASAARKGSFTGRRCPITHTSKRSSRGATRRRGAGADCTMTRSRSRRCGGSESPAAGWRATIRSAHSNDCRASGAVSRSR